MSFQTENQPDFPENTVEESSEVVEGQLVDAVDSEPSPFLALAIPSSASGNQGETTNPVLVYLASLAPSGRRTMRGKLEAVCELLTGKRDLALLPWHLLRYEHVAAIRARLEEKGLAPASINATLYALRGVAKAAWNLELMSADDYGRIKNVAPVRGSRLPAGRSLSSGELAALLDACERGNIPPSGSGGNRTRFRGFAMRRCSVFYISVACGARKSLNSNWKITMRKAGSSKCEAKATKSGWFMSLEPLARRLRIG